MGVVCAELYKTEADEKGCFLYLCNSHSIRAACFELRCAHRLLEGRARSFSRAKSFLFVLQVSSHCCHTLFYILLANSVVSYLQIIPNVVVKKINKLSVLFTELKFFQHKTLCSENTLAVFIKIFTSCQ